MTTPALEFVTSRDWKWRRATPPNIELDKCPYCHKRGYGHFYMDEEGKYLCHHCGAKGNLRSLSQHLGLLGEAMPVTETRTERTIDTLPDVDACHEALLADGPALDYLMNGRGFSHDIIVKQRLGLTTHYFREGGNVRAIVYPYLVNGNIVWAHYRSLPTMPFSESKVAKAFSSPAGYDSVLYNGEVLREGIKDIVLVEGEADCIAALDKGVVNICGVPGANIKKAAWIETLDKLELERIYIWYDKDKVGQKAAQTLAARIGVERCWKIVLPDFTIETDTGETRKGKDPNEWFANGGTLETFEHLKQTASLFDVAGVTGTADAVQELKDTLLDRGSESKYKTQWPSLNKHVGFDEGDVIDILAPEKVGKTTLGLNILEHMVETYKEDAILICLEMTQAKIARKYICMKTGVADRITETAEEARALLHELLWGIDEVQAHDEAREGELFFCYPHYRTVEDIYTLIRNCVRRYNVKWVMVDNLQLLCDTTIGSKNRTQHMSEISKNLSQIAKDYKIQMIRILQPHRIQVGKMVTTDNVDGSSQVAKDCDCMITAHRNKLDVSVKREFDEVGFVEIEASFGNEMVVNVGLSRYSQGGGTTLYYDGARSKVTELSQAVIGEMKAKANRDVGAAAIIKKLNLPIVLDSVTV